MRPEADDELARIMDGAHTTEQYLELARDLDVVEPKTPEEVYKSHLEKRPASSSHIDSARQNLASTFVNGFVNVGFGADKLMLTEGNKWLYKNKEHGMMSAAASLGALLLWDVDGGLSQIDKFLYSSDTNIKAGALLAVGVLNSGVRNECDPALALLTEYVENKAPANIKMGATLGLGLAYAGSAREEVPPPTPQRAHPSAHFTASACLPPSLAANPSAPSHCPAPLQPLCLAPSASPAQTPCAPLRAGARAAHAPRGRHRDVARGGGHGGPLARPHLRRHV